MEYVIKSKTLHCFIKKNLKKPEMLIYYTLRPVQIKPFELSKKISEYLNSPPVYPRKWFFLSSLKCVSSSRNRSRVCLDLSTGKLRLLTYRFIHRALRKHLKKLSLEMWCWKIPDFCGGNWLWCWNSRKIQAVSRYWGRENFSRYPLGSRDFWGNLGIEE